MAYSDVGIVNLSLIRIGSKTISSLTEGSAQSIAANAVYAYIRDEVLQSKEWTFTKLRVKLSMNVSDPAYGFDYAYTLPTDFLKLCTDKKNDPVVSIDYTTSGTNVFYEGDKRTFSLGYSIETLSDGTLCLFTDFDNSTGYDLYIRCIRKITDPAKFSPTFISALAFRLAAELSLTLTEDKNKFAQMMNLYVSALNIADGINQSGEATNETGDDSWDSAVR